MSLQQHPLSAAYPAMQPAEYQGLLDSISDIGVQVPITLFEGQVIDGWHRYKAATELGIECPSVELGDVDPRDFAKSQGARRNISPSQTAMAITAIYAWRPHGDQRSAVTADRVKTTKELAAIAGVGTRTIEQAKAVQANAVPAIQEAVKTGAVSVETAAAVAKLPAKEQKKIAAKGPDAMRAAAKPAPKAKPEQPPEDDGPSADELAAQAAAEEADRELVAKLLDSDEPLAALAAENKQLKAEIAQLKQARDGYMNRCNEAIALVKSRDRQIAKLEKMLKAEA